MGRPSKYPPEFRREAVELVISSGRKVAEVARSLGVTDTTLHNWLRRHREDAAQAADPGALTESERAELKKLRKKVVQLETDREILRKAAAFFARETMR
jgi:transposase